MTDEDNKKLLDVIMKQNELITLQKENIQTLEDLQSYFQKALRSRHETIQALRIRIKLQEERIENLQTNVEVRAGHITFLNATVSKLQSQA